jgi:uncharacterized protein YdhG (YjbR/CyaY superfamily)
MSSQPKTGIDKYLQSLDEPKRGSLQALRRTILEIVPEAEEAIAYGVPAFRVRGKTIAGFAAFKRHLSYLPFSGSVLDQLSDDLVGYTMTKGSLHFAVDDTLPTALVRKLIEARLAEIGPAPAAAATHGEQAQAVETERVDAEVRPRPRGR